jgi:hypothetical protein
LNLLIAALGVIVVTGLAITAMLLVRRRAPEGSYFTDGDRASGVFGVLATGFSVLLGFIVFLAFTTYDEARAGAEAEAVVVAQQVETAQYFPTAVAEELTGQLVCYGRSVVGEEWDALQASSLGDSINPWGAVMLDSMREVQPSGDAEDSAYDRFLDQAVQREEARNQRVHVVDGVVPAPLWVALGFLSLVLFAYVLFFADSGEGAVTQALLMGSVVSVISVLLLLLVFFNRPYQGHIGGLQPDSMERALRIIDGVIEIEELDLTLPCDEHGRPLDG